MNDCANTSALNAYLRTVDEEERRLDAIEARASHYLATDCSDSRTAMVLEAMHEADETTAELIADYMGSISDTNSEMEKMHDYAIIGRLLAAMISGYCAYQAKRIAENDINNAACQKCFDAGCKFCRENEE